MKELERIEQKKKSCIKRFLAMLPISVICLLLLWAWMHPSFFRNGWTPPEIFYQFAPHLSFNNVHIGQLIYVTVLAFLSPWPIYELRNWFDWNCKISDAKAKAREERLKDELK